MNSPRFAPRVLTTSIAPRLAGILPAALIAATMVLVLMPVQAQAADPTVTYFSDGISPGDDPFELQGITTAPDGNVWFIGSGRVFRITPTGTVTEFSAGITASFLTGITAGPDGNVWFTVGGGKIARITPAGVVTEFPSGELIGNANLTSITAGPDGNLWYTVSSSLATPGANRIGRITPTGTVTEFSAGITSASRPTGITSGPDGNLWFVEVGVRKIGRITPGGVVTEFSGASANGLDMTAGPDGNLWFGTSQSVARITPAGVVTEFTVGLPSGFSAFRITSAGDGNLYFTDGNLATFPQGRVGRITPAGAITVIDVGTGPPDAIGAGPIDIADGPDGNVWFTSVFSTVGRLNLPPGINVSKAGAGQGTVVSAPAGISCGTDCIEEYAPGTQVTLTASPAAGSNFAGFIGGGCSGAATTCVVTPAAAIRVTATFGVNDPRTLTVGKTGSGQGAVTSQPTGIDCGATCTKDFPGGTQIMLSAAPVAGTTFAGFSGGGCSGTATTCAVTLDQATTVTARFIRPRDLTVVNTGSGQGTVTSAPAGISCGGDCVDTYDAGTLVTLTASPVAGTRFAGFTGGNGDCSGTASTCVVTLDEAASVTGTFVAQRQLTISRAGAGQGTVSSSPGGIGCGSDCSRLFDLDSQVTLTASPAAGSDFSGFSGAGCSGASTACTVTMGQAQAVTATFALTPAPPPPPGADPPPPGPAPPAVPGPDTVRPTVSSVSVADAAFTIGSLLPQLAQASRVGTTIRFRLSEAATVRLTFARVQSGRRVGSSCRAPSRRLRSRRACIRFVTVRPAVTMRGLRAGVNSVRFQGRLSRTRRLVPGRYRLTVTAADAAGNRSLPRTARFRLLASRAR